MNCRVWVGSNVLGLARVGKYGIKQVVNGDDAPTYILDMRAFERRSSLVESYNTLRKRYVDYPSHMRVYFPCRVRRWLCWI